MKFFKKNLKFILGIAFIIFLAIIYLNNFSNSSKYKTYNSKSMNISISFPSNSKIEDKFASISITDKSGKKILINRNGTNFNNIDNFVKNSRNNINSRIKDQEKVNINGNDAIVGYLDDRKYYFIYANFAVYLLSTSSPELYDELDQIANSFKYTGN